MLKSVTPGSNRTLAKTTAIKFVVLLGVVSRFADLTYEGASILSR